MALYGTALVALAALAPGAAEEPFHDLTFEQALAKAGAEKKVVMIDFFTTWCGPCKQLDLTTWKDDGVRGWLAEKTVALKLDAEKETALASRYKVQAYPTIVFVKSDGAELERIVGYRPAETFLEEAGEFLAGKSALAKLDEKVAASPDDPMVRMERARARFQRGDHAGAAEDFLKCWDEGAQAPGYYGVRASFLVGDMSRLAAVHPPMLAAVRDRKAALRKRVMGEGPVARQDVMDLKSLAAHFDKTPTPVELFDAVRGKDVAAPLMKTLHRDAVPGLLAAKRYADVLDPKLGYVGSTLNDFSTASRTADGADEMSKTMDAYNRDRRREAACACLEALLGVEDGVAAAHVASKAMEHDRAKKMKRLLAERARASAKPAVPLLRVGSLALDEDGRARVERLIAAIDETASRPASAPAR